MASVHFTLQGKGGVGKSFISSLLYQYLHSKEIKTVGIDTDPVNNTFEGYKYYDIKRLDILDGTAVNQRAFDTLIELILDNDADFVIDNGASSFLPLSQYIIENDAIQLLIENQKNVYIHTVVTGGQALPDTLSGFDNLVKQMPDSVRIIVWLNEFFGDIVHTGIPFEKMKVYERNKSRVHGLIRIDRQTGTTFGEDIRLMLDQKLSFDEIEQSQDFGIMAKSRLKKVKSNIFQQLSLVI